MSVTDTKIQKARNLAYKKPLVKELNFEHIQDEIYEISEACKEVSYFTEGDEDSLINALEGDEDEAYEFKMMFCSLDSDCDRLCSDLQDYYIPEMFDDWFCAMKSGTEFGGYIGYDSYEDDYISLDYEDYVETESGKRISKLTKADIINQARQCFKIFVAWQSIRTRYNDLKCAFDVLREQNKEYLKLIKDIEKSYEDCMNDYSCYSEKVKKFDRLTDALPQEAWLQ